MKQLLQQPLQNKLVKRLSIPAPSRCWYETDNGWASRRWTVQDVQEARSGGAYFVKARHDFANPQAAKAAGINDE